MENGIELKHIKELEKLCKEAPNFSIRAKSVNHSVEIQYKVAWGGTSYILFSHNKAQFKKEILTLIKLLVKILINDIRPYKNRK